MPHHLLTSALVLCIALQCLSSQARAEEVRIEHVGLELLGSLERPSGKPLGPDPVALIVHGALGHHGMEFVKVLQAGLKSEGVASLGITLSLGLNARRGMFDCKLEHDHRSTDVVEEIAAWTAWLKDQGATRVAAVGHSLGAAQLAEAMLAEPAPAIERIILVAPPSDTREQQISRYRTSFGGDLEQITAAAKKFVDSGEEDTAMDVPGFLSCKDARVSAAAFQNYYGPETANVTFAHLGRLKAPSLVIAGTQDNQSPDVAVRFADAAKPPSPLTAEFALINGADHFFRDLFADELVQRIKLFIAKP